MHVPSWLIRRGEDVRVMCGGAGGKDFTWMEVGWKVGRTCCKPKLRVTLRVLYVL